MRVRQPLIMCVGVLALLASACTAHRPAVGPPVTSPAANQTTLLTMGGSATEGDGTDDRLRDAWPYVVFRDALPPSSVLVNAALDDQTVSRALADQLPIAHDVKPDDVAIWLGFDDALAGVPPADFARGLTRLVDALRSEGARRILVADLPVQIGVSVSPYNTAIRSVVSATHAELVELARTPITLTHARDLPDQPDTASQRVIAAVFTRVLRGSP